MPQYYDYESVARQAGLNADQINSLVARWREDYPEDQVLLELRLLRTCMAIKNGHCTLQQALEHESISAASTVL